MTSCDALPKSILTTSAERKQSEWGMECVEIVYLSPFMGSLCGEMNKIMYVLSRQTFNALTRG